MQPFLIIPSTTSHKREPLLSTLEVFGRLGLCDIDLNLSHLVEQGLPVEDVRAALTSNGQRLWIVSGGWCDFYQRPPQIDGTFASVGRQVSLARALNVATLRLFFGRLPFAEYGPEACRTAAENIRMTADRFPDMAFVFENHDGASLQPEVCRDILEMVDRPGVRMNFDPINFERGGVRSDHALEVLRPLIAHVHLKGVSNGECCEFGSGDVDLEPLITSLITGGYRGAFTVEYEGPFDRTVRLYEGVRLARAVVARVAAEVRS
jgi:sugar phosphate isomerase/epimerase